MRLKSHPMRTLRPLSESMEVVQCVDVSVTSSFIAKCKFCATRAVMASDEVNFLVTAEHF